MQMAGRESRAPRHLAGEKSTTIRLALGGLVCARCPYSDEVEDEDAEESHDCVSRPSHKFCGAWTQPHDTEATGQRANILYPVACGQRPAPRRLKEIGSEYGAENWIFVADPRAGHGGPTGSGLVAGSRGPR